MTATILRTPLVASFAVVGAHSLSALLEVGKEVSSDARPRALPGQLSGRSASLKQPRYAEVEQHRTPRQAIAVTLPELATNAAKYGSLSVASEVTWSLALNGRRILH